MNSTVCVFGRQPQLGLAEIESLYGSERVVPLSPYAAIVQTDPAGFRFSRLGGSVKAGTVLAELPYSDWRLITEYLVKNVSRYITNTPEGKIRFGLSVYGMNVPIKHINSSGLAIKKHIKSVGRSVRVVPNKAAELNAAQLLHNQLTGPTGTELLLIKNGSGTVLAQTFAVQDITAYAARDQQRPMRDAVVGMLPPKLAQIIINLAVGTLPEAESSRTLTILDPFCGTGVVLQEALLMGYDAYGSDIEPRMAEYSQANLDWLKQQSGQLGRSVITVADATTCTWTNHFDTIACETYLGRPFTTLPKQDVLAEVVRDVNTIHKKFLQNILPQIPSGFRMCIAVPAWHKPGTIIHLPLLDRIEDLGYTRVSFAHVRTRDMVYHRPDQTVGRELVILQKN